MINDKTIIINIYDKYKSYEDGYKSVHQRELPSGFFL